MNRLLKQKDGLLQSALQDVRGLDDLILAQCLDLIANYPSLRWMPLVEEAARRLGLRYNTKGLV
jgi:hypothetical protein